MVDYDTPRELEPSSEGVHPWIQWHLIRLHERTKSINVRLDAVCIKQEVLDRFRSDAEVRLALGAERFVNLNSQIEDLKKARNNSKVNHDSGITFQWLLEKFALPIVMLLIGGAVALLFVGGP
jgi:hypothetical protein